MIARLQVTYVLSLAHRKVHSHSFHPPFDLVVPNGRDALARIDPQYLPVHGKFSNRIRRFSRPAANGVQGYGENQGAEENESQASD